ncbi:MAG TPA: hypothetical protein VK453_18650 [Micromonosporaceae bacterium]|nr:hypothetical protein [Micromonosporaceae bacterium]
MPESTFGSLFDDTADANWPSGADVRRSAHRAQLRAQVAGLAAAIVAVGAVGAGAVAVNDRNRSLLLPDPATSATAAPSPSVPPTTAPSAAPTSASPNSVTTTATTKPPPSATPSRPALTNVPIEAMLRPADVGPGEWATNDNPESGDWGFAAIIGSCPARPNGHQDPIHRRTRNISRSTTGPSDHVIHDVGLYRRGTAAAAFNYYRAGAVACARHKDTMSSTEMTVKILAEGFAGQRSMLVESTSEHGRGLWVFVVHGDLMSELAFAPETAEYGKQLGGRAAQRMCTAQGTCG